MSILTSFVIFTDKNRFAYYFFAEFGPFVRSANRRSSHLFFPLGILGFLRRSFGSSLALLPFIARRFYRFRRMEKGSSRLSVLIIGYLVGSGHGSGPVCGLVI